MSYKRFARMNRRRFSLRAFFRGHHRERYFEGHSGFLGCGAFGAVHAAALRPSNLVFKNLSHSGRGEIGTLRHTRRSPILAHLRGPAAEPFAKEFYAAYTG
jgi:hypothetical protein